jgi:hypothetical protein
MENGKEPAFATASDSRYQAGLTKREYFAGLALQSYINNYFGGSERDIEHCVKMSVHMADALLEELKKTEKKPE